MHILPILGTELDNELKDGIQNSNLTARETTLIQTYIQPCLVQYSFTQLIPFLRLRFVNNAVVVMGATDQSSSASYEDLRPVMDTATNAAEFYRQRLIDYITNNTSLFPKYNTNSGADLDPTTNNYYSGLNLNPSVPMSKKLKSFLQGANITIYGC